MDPDVALNEENEEEKTISRNVISIASVSKE